MHQQKNQVDTDKQIPCFIKTIRKSRNFSRKKLAKRLNISKSLLKGYETGRINITVKQLSLLTKECSWKTNLIFIKE